MKKIVVLIFLASSLFAAAQKKKKTIAVAKVVPILVTKVGNDSAEILKNNFYLVVANGDKKDTLSLKTYQAKPNPTACSLKSFSAKGTLLHYVTWTELSTTETNLKKEETTTSETQIWNPATKTLVIGNTNSVTKIKETVFLDKLKNASETQERIKRSGYELILIGEDFLLKDKASETKYTYNATSQKYEVFRMPAPVSTKQVTKKKKL